MRLLSIDWDYFIPTYPLDREKFFLYDWTMSDNGFHRSTECWVNRGTTFLRNNLPLPDTTGLETTFWSRFRFAKGAALYYGDSHLFAACIPERRIVTDVWNYDAHHDLGYKGTTDSIIDAGLVECDNWMGWYKVMGAKVRVFYPRWKPNAKEEENKPVFRGIRQIDNEEPVSVPFHAVYVCRSGAWSPPWLDPKFTEFLKACPVPNPVNLQTDYDAMPPREFSMTMLHEHAAMWDKLHEMRKAGLLTVKRTEEAQ